MARQHCLYCEQEGRETELIRSSGHWAFCPIHSKGYLESVTADPPAKPDLRGRARKPGPA